jgi:hypothetical protein
MRRFQNWMAAVGILAMSPGLGFAAKTIAPELITRNKTESQAEAQGEESAAPSKSASSAKAPVARSGPSNQEVAQNIARALKNSNLAGYDIDIEYQDGVATLRGSVANALQNLAATKAVANVKGVKRVDNQLSVGAKAAPRIPSDSRQSIQQVQFIPAVGAEPAQAPPGAGVQEFAGGPGLPASPPPYVPGHVPMPPGYGHPGSGQSHMVYDQPNLPNYAWPTYASYPNYAQVSYPSQYSASAWPYIGPFYPYPQIPLGWRQAQLEWDDGYWKLNFRPRTDRWWWFLNSNNW